jgi:hypothetical protein
LSADQTANIVVVLGHDAQKTDVLQGLQRERQYPTLHVHVLPTSSIPTSDSKSGCKWDNLRDARIMPHTPA